MEGLCDVAPWTFGRLGIPLPTDRQTRCGRQNSPPTAADATSPPTPSSDAVDDTLQDAIPSTSAQAYGSPMVPSPSQEAQDEFPVEEVSSSLMQMQIPPQHPCQLQHPLLNPLLEFSSISSQRTRTGSFRRDLTILNHFVRS